MRALNIAATGMAAQNTRVEVISHNLANMSTTAYNARRAEFTDLHYQQVERPGTINSADGEPVARIGLVTVEDQSKLFREAGVLFRADTAPTPVEEGRVLQGFLEQSNVNPVAELARMVEVQRAYEYGQKLMDAEDERIRKVVSALGQQA